MKTLATIRAELSALTAKLVTLQNDLALIVGDVEVAEVIEEKVEPVLIENAEGLPVGTTLVALEAFVSFNGISVEEGAVMTVIASDHTAIPVNVSWTDSKQEEFQDWLRHDKEDSLRINNAYGRIAKVV